MKHEGTARTVVALGLVGALAALPVSAGKGAGKNAEKVRGYVVKVEQQVRTDNQGESTRLTIRTRKGDEMQLQLGGGDCQGCVVVGDRVQAHLRREGRADGAQQIQTMKVRRNGQMFSLGQSGNGSLVRQQSRLGDGSGSGQQSEQRARTRLKDGSNCNDNGPQSGRGGANTGGHPRSGGGGGGGGRG